MGKRQTLEIIPLPLIPLPNLARFDASALDASHQVPWRTFSFFSSNSAAMDLRSLSICFSNCPTAS